MKREPVTPENPLGLVRLADPQGFSVGLNNAVRDVDCPICGALCKVAAFDERHVLEGHFPIKGYEGDVITEGFWANSCPGSRMILEEHKPVTLSDCTERLDRLIEMLEGE
jgi:hypothetical protein